ncbi:MAG: hypothetical protein AAF849_05570 [Bacteroidota bacterium]
MKFHILRAADAAKGTSGGEDESAVLPPIHLPLQKDFRTEGAENH